MKPIQIVAPAILCGALFVSANVVAEDDYRDRSRQQNQTEMDQREGTYGNPYGSERPRYPDDRDDQQYPDRSGPAGTDGEIDGYGTGGRGTGTGSETGTESGTMR